MRPWAVLLFMYACLTYLKEIAHSTEDLDLLVLHPKFNKVHCVENYQQMIFN